jgi:hypothetical protein
MQSEGLAQHAPLPRSVPHDLAEEYDRATKFLVCFNDIFESLPSTYYGGQYMPPTDELLQSLIDNFNSMSALLTWSSFHLFRVAFLEEVLAARKEYTGEFNPDVLSDYFGEGLTVDVGFKSAFHYVSTLASRTLSRSSSPGSHEIFRKYVRAKPNSCWRIELQPRPETNAEQYDIEVAYFQGTMEHLAYVPVPEIIFEELRREVLAISMMRSRGKSWQAVGDPHGPDSVLISTDTKEKLENLGTVKLIILKGLLDCGAVGSENSIPASLLAQKIKMENDSTLKSHLSWLRDLRLVGGAKGQRGYWIDEECREALQQHHERVAD